LSRGEGCSKAVYFSVEWLDGRSGRTRAESVVNPARRERFRKMKSTHPSTISSGSTATRTWAEGTYLTDGTRLLRVIRVDANGAEVEDARTEQLEWHPVGELATATRAVTPSTPG
jgi:hypothetical protein